MGNFLKDIPYEIRLMIYREFFASTPLLFSALIRDPERYRWGRPCQCPRTISNRECMSLLYVSKEIYEEARPVFLQKANVHLRICQEHHPRFLYEPPRFVFSTSTEMKADVFIMLKQVLNDKLEELFLPSELQSLGILLLAESATWVFLYETQDDYWAMTCACKRWNLEKSLCRTFRSIYTRDDIEFMREWHNPTNQFAIPNGTRYKQYLAPGIRETAEFADAMTSLRIEEEYYHKLRNIPYLTEPSEQTVQRWARKLEHRNKILVRWHRKQRMAEYEDMTDMPVWMD